MYGCDIHIISKKNRAQGAAALLNNWEEAKAALQDTYGAEGSALEENQHYMESISGHVAQLQNHLQELAAVNINSDWLKDAITFLDKIIQLVTTLTDKVGGLNIVVGGAVGALLGLTKHGENRFRQPTTPTGEKVTTGIAYYAAILKTQYRNLRLLIFSNIRGKLFRSLS